jgi:molybdopterin synthase catalytic subunit
MIEITQKPISPELVINKVKTKSSGCVATYVGLIRHFSQGKEVASVEYEDPKKTAESKLLEIDTEIRQKWQVNVNQVAISHRIGKLEPGEINFIVAVAATHREEGFAACQYAVDRFKEVMPTKKTETYTDGSFRVEGGL